MLSLCLKKDDERMSPVRLAIVPPISAQISCAEGPQAPRVSIAIGTKVYRPEETSWLYLCRFFSSAKTAADPAAEEERFRCEGAKVSGQVKSQTRYFP